MSSKNAVQILLQTPFEPSDARHDGEMGAVMQAASSRCPPWAASMKIPPLRHDAGGLGDLGASRFSALPEMRRYSHPFLLSMVGGRPQGVGRPLTNSTTTRLPVPQAT
ncbi:MAG: hypothetical protein AAAB11_11370, partial [Rhizobium giardinii]